MTGVLDQRKHCSRTAGTSSKSCSRSATGTLGGPLLLQTLFFCDAAIVILGRLRQPAAAQLHAELLDAPAAHEVPDAGVLSDQARGRAELQVPAISCRLAWLNELQQRGGSGSPLAKHSFGSLQ